MSILFALAGLLGTDPVTMIMLGIMAGLCAHFLGRMAASPWSSAAFWPLLMAGGLAADDGAVALGLYPAFDVAMAGQGWEANWSMIGDGLPNVLVATTVGMTVTALLLMIVLRLRKAAA